MSRLTQLAASITFLLVLSQGCKSFGKKDHAVSKPVDQESNAREKQASLIDQYAYDGPSFLKDRKLEVLRRLAPLLSEEKKKVKSDYDENELIEFIALKFDGLNVDGFISNDEIAITGVDILSSRWPMKNGLGVGCPASKVMEFLGKPNSTNDGILLYEGETESLQFVISNKKVSKIMIGYYSG